MSALQQDAGRPRTSNAGADSTPLSSRDLYGTGDGRLQRLSDQFGDLADRYERRGEHPLARSFRATQRHYAALANAGMGQKRGQSLSQSAPEGCSQ
jgi:hypothetical protein